MSEAGSSVYSRAEIVIDLVTRSQKLRTAALQAQREMMEVLLPSMEEMWRELEEEEVRLKGKRSTFMPFFRLGSSKAHISSGQSQKSQSDTALLPERGSRAARTRTEVQVQPVNISPRSKAKVRQRPTNLFDASDASLQSKVTKTPTTLFTGGSPTSTKVQLKTLRIAKQEFLETLQEVREKAVQSVKRVQPRGSVCGVHNPETGQIVWAENADGGVYGIWNPVDRKIEWNSKVNYGLCAVLNLATNKIEWNETYNGGVHGVYNPNSGQVEWKRYKAAGVFGVWNPILEQVEWQINKYGGVIGWFDPREEKVQWEMVNDHGICRVNRDYENGGYVTLCCNVTPWRR